jgi:hypothetical protein
VRIASVALWTGAVVDALAALQLLLPTTFVVASFAGLRQSGEAGQLALEAAALLLGWSAIEIWAAARPVERRAVMYVGLAVLVVFAAQNAWQVAVAGADLGANLPILVLQVALIVLFVVAIVAVRREATRRRPYFG